jgi:histidinol-phosphate aminotransferase
MTGPRLTALVETLPSSVPFVGPEAQERARGRRFRARIGANENVFGPSPKAVEAMCAAAAEAWMYGDPENHDLKLALARHHRVAPENIVVGEGIDGLFGYIARMTVEPGTAVVTSLGAYPTFNFHVTGFGGRLHFAPYRDDHEDLAALLDLARRENARLVFLANPDNPMGTWWRAHDVAGLIKALPDNALLCLDEAYCEFAPPEALAPLDVDNPQVLRFRTFSKAYGLAGARIGYAIGEAGLIKAFDKIRNHFGVNRIAQAGALAALSRRGPSCQGHCRGCRGARGDRARRGGKRARGPAVGRQFRRHRLRPRRRFRPPGAAGPDRARRLRAHAGGGAARPLHPGERRARGRPRGLRRGAARSARRRAGVKRLQGGGER